MSRDRDHMSQHEQNGPHEGQKYVEERLAPVKGAPLTGAHARRRFRRAMLRALATGGGLTAVGLGSPLAPGALSAATAAASTSGEGSQSSAGSTTQGSTPPAQQSGASETTTTTSSSAQSSTSESSSSSSSSSSSTTTTTTATTSSPPTQQAPAEASAGSAPTGGAAPGATHGGSGSGGGGGGAGGGGGTGSSAAAPTVVVQAPQQPAPEHPARRGSKAGTHGLGNGKGGANGGTEAGAGAGKKGARGAGKGGANTPAEVPPGTPNGVAGAPQSLVGAGETLASLLGQSQVSAQALAFYRIPLFLLPIYQAAAVQYGVPWQILAAINEVETDYGTDQSVSSAGAVGWMQFMPETWLQYGVDALNAGYADPYNPVDAIFAAARYLHAAGASHSLRGAILAYNHSDAYAESVLLRAKLISTYPQSVIAVLTGLTEGQLPVAGAHVGSYLSISKGSGAGVNASALSPANATAGATPVEPAQTPTPGVSLLGGKAPAPTTPGVSLPGEKAPAPTTPGVSPPGEKAPAPSTFGTNALAPSAAAHKRAKAHTTETLRFVDLSGAPGAPVTAVEDGRIVKLGHSHRLGNYLDLQDIYGNIFTYAGLGSIAPRYRLPSLHGHAGTSPSSPSSASSSAAHAPVPTLPLAAGRRPPLTLQVKTSLGRAATAAPAGASAAATKTVVADAAAADAQAGAEEGPPPAGMGHRRLYANPNSPVARVAATRRGAVQHAVHSGRWLPLRLGSVISQGTVLGHLSGTRSLNASLSAAPTPSAHMRFAIRPAGDSTTIDPRPIIANWRQLDTALHPKGVKGTIELLGATVSQVFLMSQGELERTVLSDPGIGLSRCARQDVAAGSVDGRVLAVLAFLSRSGLKPTVAGLRCQPDTHALAAGHRLGTAMEITAINGVPIAGHQGEGSIADTTIRALLTLKGRFAPAQIVSLMYYPGTANTLARAARWNSIHIGFHAIAAVAASASSQVFTQQAHSAGPGQTAPSPLVSAGAVPTGAAPLALSGDLSAAQWNQLIGRIGALPRPVVAKKPTASAIRDPQAAAGNRNLGAGTLPAGSENNEAG
jgi:Transglycosylase SLT domain